MSREEYRTGLWKKQSEKGTIYYSGKIKIGLQEYQLTLFKNNKTNEKQPDLNILVRDNINSQENSKQSTMVQKNSELEENKSNIDQVFADFGDNLEVTDEDLAF